MLFSVHWFAVALHYEWHRLRRLPRHPLKARKYPIMDKIADKIIQKYQTFSCEQLAQQKAQQQGKPKSAEEQRAVEILRNDPQMRQAFINRVAAPIANKLFECGMIP